MIMPGGGGGGGGWGMKAMILSNDEYEILQ